MQGVSQWLRVCLQAVRIAVNQAEQFAARLEGLRLRWEQDLAVKRREQNLGETPRADSATTDPRDPAGAPVLTTASVMRLFSVSRPAAVTALDELTCAGVLSKRRLDRRIGGYLAMDYWGWGSLPDQYGRRFDEDDGETPVPPDPHGSDLPAIRYDWGPRPRA